MTGSSKLQVELPNNNLLVQIASPAYGDGTNVLRSRCEYIEVPASSLLLEFQLELN